MTPDALAHLHARAMTHGSHWSATDFADLLATSGSFLTLAPSSLQKYAPGGARGGETLSQNLEGFALGRLILDEVELLTLVVAPEQQGRGLGKTLLNRFETEALCRGASTAFLEVAATNAPALALYGTAGWAETGRRPAYYTAGASPVDAILMSKALTPA